MSGSRATVTIKGPNEMYVLRLLDQRLREVKGSGARQIQLEVSPGIYTARCEAGGPAAERTFRVSAGENQTIRFSPDEVPRYESAAPVSGALNNNEYHSDYAADRLAGKPDLKWKEGGVKLLVMNRRLAHNRGIPVSLEGFSLISEGGELVTLVEPAVSRVKGADLLRDLQHGRDSIVLDVPPGGYVLCWPSTPDGESDCAGLPVWVPEGWNTLVFLAVDRDQHIPSPRLVSIHLSSRARERSEETFGPGDRSRKNVGSLAPTAAEMALASLRTGRRQLSNEMLMSLLYDKFRNPMSGILGAYMLCERESPDWPLFSEVIKRLDELVPGHPDIEGLLAKSRARGWTESRLPQSVTFPPTIGLGLSAIAELDWKTPIRLVRPASMAEFASLQWMRGGPWTQFGMPAAGIRERSGIDVRASLERELFSHSRTISYLSLEGIDESAGRARQFYLLELQRRGFSRSSVGRLIPTAASSPHPAPVSLHQPAVAPPQQGHQYRQRFSPDPTSKAPAARGTKYGPKYVYTWGNGRTDGDGSMKALLGGKGANLAEMTRIGLPVPPGFSVTTEVCTYFYAHKKTYPSSLQAQMEAGVKNMEKIMGCKFGDAKGMPLLVAVRSGARDSMPGMMDTIHNLGLNDETVLSLVAATQNERFAWDCYRRFVQMYGDVVLGAQKTEGEDHEPFEVVIEGYKHEKYHKDIVDSDLTAEDQKELVKRFKALVKRRTGRGFPSDPWEQLRGAAGAVFGSWMNDRAIVYRRKYGIPAEWGTAVNVQAMVYGNTGETSGSGVAFTRNPASGANEFYGEFLVNAQGEDVVAGVRTPQPIALMKKAMPKPFAELMKVRHILEKHFKDVQDVEFTVQEGRLFMLQTRNAKRTAAAALKFSVDMVNEGLIDWKTAVLRNPADQLDQLLAPIFDLAEVSKAKVLAKGLPAGPGATSGRIYLNADRAAAAAERGERVLLVRNETSPEDLRGMIAAEGILTARGGVSSHAALVARQMGKVCISGASAIDIDYGERTVKVAGQTFEEGDYLSIDGNSGTVYGGRLNVASSEIITGILRNDKVAQKTEKFRSFLQLMEWCSRATKMAVRTNADTPEQTRIAMAFGAQGIGLARTEHMFFEGDRIDAMREMILATTLEARTKALAKLLPYQREDFTRIFRELKGLPATIRLLDPPLHEFLPHTKEQQVDLSKKIGVPVKTIIQRVQELHEFNPMLGHRGCRLGIAYPEITGMQARAIFEAAADVAKTRIPVNPEVMIPLVGFQKEFDLQAGIVHAVAKQVMAEKKVSFEYQVGAMIEVPRGALTADEIAKGAEFFSFGTNDLTQTALGISRDDMGAFFLPYTEAGIFKTNPFATLDATGVGQLMETAVTKGRSTRPNIKLGICGEHGGDPDSVKFCHKLGLNYVSCSPYRVPVARLAAAQAAIEEATVPAPGAERKVAKEVSKKEARKK